MSSSADQLPTRREPTFLSYGFRPFFFGASLWATVAMVLWLSMLNGLVALPTALDPVSWHAHEFLFGYLGAVVAGFLLTAMPNWTGRRPITGWPLGGLFALWIVGRIAMAASAGMPPFVAAVAALAFPVALAAVVAHEIVRGRNWRNLVILALLALLIAGNAVFHWEAAHGRYAAGGVGLRLGLGAGVMMVAVVGGRIVPSFTRNWLVKRGGAALPAPPMQRFDKLALLMLALALSVWVVAPLAIETGLGLMLAGVLHLWRMARWKGHRTAAEPLVLVLHAGYAFVPLGALALASVVFWPDALGMAAAQHVWMAGALGMMTLAVMTRATLGHTGRMLRADAGAILIYLMLLAAVVARVSAEPMQTLAPSLHAVSGIAWIAAFGGFSVLYGRLLLCARP